MTGQPRDWVLGLPCVARARAAARRYAPRLSSILRQFAAVRLVESSTVLAAEAFMSLGQIVLVLIAFSSDGLREQLRSSMSTVFGLHGAALEEVKQVLAPGDAEVRQAWGTASIVLLLITSLSLSRALQRVCQRCWHIPPAGARLAAWRWLPWLIVLVIALVAEASIQSGFGAGPALAVPSSLVAGTLLWWWSQHLLLGGRIAWLPLLPGSVLAAIGALAMFWGSRVYTPSALNRSIAQFGPLGVVFASMSWLIAFCGVLVGALAAGSAVATWQPFARWLRTPHRSGG